MKKVNVLYMKMLLFYTYLLLVIILILEGVFVYNISQQNRESCMYSQQQLCQKESAEVQKMLNHAQELTTSLYADEMQITDVINYLMYDSETYMKNRLDNYSRSNYTFYNDKEHFIDSAINGFAGIEGIGLVSYQNGTLTQYYQKKDVIVEVLEEKRLKENRVVEVKNGTLRIRKLISNTLTQKPLGEIRFSYDNQTLAGIYEEEPLGVIQIFTDQGEILYSSDGSKEVMGEDPSSQMVYMVTGELSVVNYVKKSEAGRLPANVWVILVLSGLCLFALGEVLVNWYLQRFEKRITGILDVMKQIREGNLDVVIRWEERPDELDLIAENLDIMCKDLKRHIDRSYVAEIAQKKAEMEAMQNQINPHFLYNTLEAIRMNSIENGDRVSGKMLYNLAIIFRSQIKENRLISLAKELYYGKKYMELYEFRHPTRFRFEILCPDEYLQKMILKFSVQPIIENYFAHGIRAMDRDNFIQVEVYKESLLQKEAHKAEWAGNSNFTEDEDILGQPVVAVVITDNGTGMTDEEIADKNEELSKENGSNDSIGLMNIQRRIRAEFGAPYGIFLKHAENGNGLCVKLWIPDRDMEENDV